MAEDTPRPVAHFDKVHGMKTAVLTNFAIARHWNPDFKGTCIRDMTPEGFMTQLDIDSWRVELGEGYAPFCKLCVVSNFTSCKPGVIPITVENYQYLRSGYHSRTREELPVLSRWLELPVPVQRANYIVLVMYDREQLLREHELTAKQTCAGQPITMEPFDVPEGVDYGIVALLAQMGNQPEPMKPATMLRNAMGMEGGGSGEPIDRDEYLKAVDFWSTHATVR